MNAEKTRSAVILDELLEKENINPNQLAQKMGISRSQPIYDIMNGKVKKLSEKYADKILAAYPHYNKRWLLTGEQPMVKTEFAANARQAEVDMFMQVPLIPVRASAGYLTGYGDLEYIESLPTMPVIVDKQYKGKYRLFEVDGDSMDDGTRDSICDKDIVLAREVKRELWQSKLHIRDWDFVIVHRTDKIAIKQITEHDVATCRILCHPTNPLYEDYWVELNDVLELYNVIKIVDRNTRR